MLDVDCMYIRICTVCMNVKVSLQLLMHSEAIFLVEKLCHVGRDRSTVGCNSHEGNLYVIYVCVKRKYKKRLTKIAL